MASSGCGANSPKKRRRAENPPGRNHAALQPTSDAARWVQKRDWGKRSPRRGGANWVGRSRRELALQTGNKVLDKVLDKVWGKVRDKGPYSRGFRHSGKTECQGLLPKRGVPFFPGRLGEATLP